LLIFFFKIEQYRLLLILNQNFYWFECYTNFFIIKNILIKLLLPLNFNINIKYLIFVKLLYLITFNFIKKWILIIKKNWDKIDLDTHT